MILDWLKIVIVGSGVILVLGVVFFYYSKLGEAKVKLSQGTGLSPLGLFLATLDLFLAILEARTERMIAVGPREQGKFYFQRLDGKWFSLLAREALGEGLKTASQLAWMSEIEDFTPEGYIPVVVTDEEVTRAMKEAYEQRHALIFSVKNKAEAEKAVHVLLQD